MEKDKVDEVIKSAMEDMNSPPPPPEEFFRRLNETYKERRKKRFAARMKTFSAAAVICLMLIALGSLVSKDATAVGNIISRLFTVEGKGSINNILFEFFHEPKKEQDGIREIATLYPVTMSLEEAQAKVPFKILLPNYLPDGYSLDHVTLEEVHDPSYIVTLYYKNPNDEILSISQENIVGESGRGYMYDKDDTTVEEISIDGSLATLANLKDKYVRLFWLRQSISIEIFGQISKQDAIKIAENLGS